MANTSSGDSGDGNSVDSRLARRRQDAIGNRLRQLYDSVVDETVPDEFLSFLTQADKREADESDSSAKAKGNGAGSKSGS
jgi:hypothetical protein